MENTRTKRGNSSENSPNIVGSRSKGSDNDGSMKPQSGKKSFTLEDFALGKKLGEGTLGVVYRAKELRTGKIVVLKQMSKEAVKEQEAVEQIRRECEIHVRCRHKNIVVLHCWFMDEDSIYLVLEHCSGGTMLDMLNQQPDQKLGEKTAAKVIYDVTMSLYYLRTKFEIPIIHRDIKPENILVSRDKKTGEETFKLADFGWAVAMTPASVRDTLCGTTEYFPPEVLKSESYSAAFDIWTLGVLLYEILVGKTPFVEGGGSSEEENLNECNGDNYQDAQIMSRILKGTFTIPSHISDEASDLIKKLLTIEPSQRLTSLRKIMQHPWIVRYCGQTTLPESRQGKKLYEEAIKMTKQQNKVTETHESSQKSPSKEENQEGDSRQSKQTSETEAGEGRRRSVRLSKRRRSLNEKDLTKEAFGEGNVKEVATAETRHQPKIRKITTTATKVSKSHMDRDTVRRDGKTNSSTQLRSTNRDVPVSSKGPRRVLRKPLANSTNRQNVPTVKAPTMVKVTTQPSKQTSNSLRPQQKTVLKTVNNTTGTGKAKRSVYSRSRI